MTIKVLAESVKDKGRLLNQIVRRLLDELGYDDFRVFSLTLDDMEQDFSVPGPYGH